ncbi:DUF2203 family protein [Paenibacillus psychroresistens]|uniref:DUF2203 family protein n=1 Tax=Paenibacillus psychroresistens TaxID=1778678 RepID=A0A6B8RHE4_9BACL|nr:DUF2203 domain-containing protein [Paenibacillus psychroresistens]QGQ95901.1 DUF2203 family protein [Paenibacillus psychroresistens]
MTTRYFTLDEANLLLPFVDQELIKLQALKREFQEKYLDLKRKKQAFSENKNNSSDKDPFFTMETELEFMQIEAKSHMNSVENKGIEIKDIDIGLVDFPAIINGNEVLLCWRQGEARIGYFHGRQEGFSGRQAIE